MKSHAQNFAKRLLPFLFAVMLALLLSLTACAVAASPSGDGSSSEGAKASVTLSVNEATVEVGKSCTLTVTVKNTAETPVWSSSAEEVAKVEDGVVTGVSVGSAAITVSAGGASAVCSVTVTESTSVPVIVLSQTEAEPLVGTSVTIAATVTCDGGQVDAPLTWSSYDESVATVSNGTITGVSGGSTTVRVRTVWLGVSAEQTVSVTVKNDVSLTLNKSELILGTADMNGFATAETLEAVLKINGQTAAGEVKWSSSDVEIAAVNDEGTVSAGKAGAAVVTAVWKNADGTEISVTCSVTVTQIEAETAVEAVYEQYTGYTADASNTLFAYAGVPNTESLVIDLSAYGPSDGIYDVTLTKNGTETVVSGVASEGKVSIAAADATAVEGGEYKFAVNAGSVIYNGSLLVVTKYLETKADVEMLQAYGKVSGNDAVGYTYGGYYVMKNDIDMGGTGYSNQANLVRAPLAVRWAGAPGVTLDKSIGFTGTFDGQGHTLFNGQYRAGGLFGAVADTGVVRNVGISGAKIAVDTSAFNGILGYNFYGALTNVYVNVHFFRESGAAIQGHHSVLAFYMNAAENALTDVVVYATLDEASAEAGSPCALVHWTGGTQKCSNVYMVSDIPLTDGGSGAFSGVTRYTLNEVRTGSASFKGFSDDYWNTSGDIPTFKTSDDVSFEDVVTFTLDKTTVQLSVVELADVGTTYTLTATLIVNGTNVEAAFGWSSSDDGIVAVRDGAITAIAVGNAVVTASYTSEAGELYTVSCNVEVISNEFATGLSLTYEIYGGFAADADAIGGYRPVANSDNFMLDLSGYTVTDGDVTVTFTLGTDSITLSGSADSGIVTVSGEAMTALEGGSTAYAFSVNNYGRIFTGKVTAVTKYLRTKADVEMMQIYGKIAADNTYGGYFLLANDIDMGAAGYSGQINLVRAPLATRYTGGTLNTTVGGFTGRFDGQGYTLFNGQYRAGGLFGSVASSAVICHFGISGAKIAVDTSVYNAIIAYNLYGQLVDAYINVHFFRENTALNMNTHHSILAHHMSVASKGYLKNVLVYATAEEAIVEAGNVVCGLVHWSNGAQPSNGAYLISDLPLNGDASSFSAAVRYAIADVEAGTVSFKISTANWDNTGSIPVWKTAVSQETEN